ncbi:hypothetical protein STEG23_037124, partial [Scotinomys teguina]
MAPRLAAQRIVRTGIKSGLGIVVHACKNECDVTICQEKVDFCEVKTSLVYS